MLLNEIGLCDIAYKFAKHLSKLNTEFVFYLQGELGVGKTTFARAFINYFGFHNVKSPTFSMVETYPLNNHPYLTHIHHFDCYRINKPEELVMLGIGDYQSKSICLFEWAEKGAGVIMVADIILTISDGNNSKTRRMHTHINSNKARKLTQWLNL